MSFFARHFGSLVCRHRCSARIERGFRPRVEELEDRRTPSTVDLTALGAIGSVNNAIFRQFSPQPTGSGVINSFVRIQSTKGAIQQGYNSDYRPVQFDENTSPQFTRGLALADVPVVDIGGVDYREFLLDINQKASSPQISLDELRIFVGNAPNLTGYDVVSHQLAGLPAVYDLDSGGDNWIKLDARLNQGSGKGDMLAYIPDSAFAGGTYVYLYSKFGVNVAPNGGFEEWAAGKSALTAATGSISGSVFSGATGFGGAIVFIDSNHNGVLDKNEVYTFTDNQGNYQFNFLATGLGNYSVYDVSVQAPDNYTIDGTSVYLVSLQNSGQQAGNINFYLLYTPPQPPPGGDTPPGTINA